MVQKNFDRDKIFRKIVRNSKYYAKINRRWNNYSYQIPNQWQGKCKNVYILGDKKPAGMTGVVASDDNLIPKLRKVMKIPLKFIHIVRNPYNNITTQARVKRKSIVSSTRWYFTYCDYLMRMRKNIDTDELLVMKHEDMVCSFGESLLGLCDFLGISCPDDYVKDCRSIVFGSPKVRFDRRKWSDEAIQQVSEKMVEYDFLQEYSVPDELDK